MVTKKQLEAKLKSHGIQFSLHDKKEVLAELLKNHSESLDKPKEPESLPIKEILISQPEPLEKQENFRVVDINGKKYRKYFSPDGSTSVKLIE